MKFYMPDWDDRVDPGFDFVSDSFTADRDVRNDVYAHELFTVSPYDGILISRAVVEKSKGNIQRLLEQQARAYFRLDTQMEVFGDCGAFSYVNDDEPRYDVEDVLDYYDTVGVDYGVSVDHLVVSGTYKTEKTTEFQIDGTVINREIRKLVKMSNDERERRVKITLDNASKFINLHKKRGYRFKPIGVAQGWSPKVYGSSTVNLIRMGYSYIALGGLARSRPDEIMAVLKEVNAAIDDTKKSKAIDVRLHLFGVANLNILKHFPSLRVESIDSASYLRKAWLRSGTNYLTLDRDWFTAIRVPQSHNPRVREYLSQNGKSVEEAVTLEQECLRLLNDFNKTNHGKISTAKVVEKIIEYDQYLVRDGDDGKAMRNINRSRALYSRALNEQPWNKCICEVCKTIGIHVLIFRGTNRNKRRGFHNTWTFRRYMEDQIG